jgi:MerR family copper efflux transcriptional regulator
MADRLTVGQVARAAGVSAKAVRLYEERGLLPLAERSEAGYRIFTGQDVETTRFIRRARGLGLGLDAVGEVLALRQAGRQPCARVEALLDERISQIDRTVAELQELRTALINARSGPASSAAREDDGVCPIIDAAT